MLPAAAQAEPGGPQTEEARALAKLIRHDESLREGGILKPPPPTPPQSAWPAVASLAIALAAAGGVRSVAKKFGEETREAGARASLTEALGSPFRNVRLDALSAMIGRSDIREFPVGKLLQAKLDPDHEVSEAARRVLAKHADTPMALLKHIAERDTNLNARADALTMIESRSLRLKGQA